jgi:2-dehydropantoate 2-reductase
VTRRRYAVIGTGAVGSFYGARLAAAGHEVHFLARSDADALRTGGLRVESVDGDIVLPEVSVATDPADLPPVDVVLVAVKTTANGALGELLGPLDASGRIVVAMQNGLGVDDQAAAAAPASTVLGGLCFVCATRERPGFVRHLDFGAVSLGERTADGAAAGITPAVEAVGADLAGAGIEIRRRPDLVAARWQKLMWNMPYNGLSVVLDAGTDQLQADPSSRALVTRLMREVEAASVAIGHPTGDGFVDQMLEYTDRMTPYAPSMKLDHEAGRPMELAAIYDEPLRVAAAAGAPMRELTALADLLHFLDDARGQSAAERTAP